MNSPEKPVAIVCANADVFRRLTKNQAGRRIQLGLQRGWLGQIAGRSVVVSCPTDESALVYAATRQLQHMYNLSRFVFFGNGFSLEESSRAGDIGMVTQAERVNYPAMFESRDPYASCSESGSLLQTSSKLAIAESKIEAIKFGVEKPVSQYGLQTNVPAWKALEVNPLPWHASQWAELKTNHGGQVTSQSICGFYDAVADNPEIPVTAFLMIAQGISGAVIEEFEHRKKLFQSTATEVLRQLLKQN